MRLKVKWISLYIRNSPSPTDKYCKMLTNKVSKQPSAIYSPCQCQTKSFKHSPLKKLPPPPFFQKKKRKQKKRKKKNGCMDLIIKSSHPQGRISFLYLPPPSLSLSPSLSILLSESVTGVLCWAGLRPCPCAPGIAINGRSLVGRVRQGAPLAVNSTVLTQDDRVMPPCRARVNATRSKTFTLGAVSSPSHVKTPA